MSTTAVIKGVRLSAQKGRLVADQIRGLPVDRARAKGRGNGIEKQTCHITITVGS